MRSHSPSMDTSRKETPLETDQDPETLELVNDMQQGISNILVAVRCRPLTKREVELDDYKTVHILDDKLVIIIDPAAKASNRTKEKRYAFDYAFGENASQQEIFSKTTYFLLDGVLNGYNATVFAYGPTGAGKTYTMLGEVDSPGIMLMSFIEVFSRIEGLSRERKYSVKISYLEIYNEVVKDLISPSNAFLDIREDPEKGITVSGLTEIDASNPDQVIQCLRMGNKRRTCEPTEANLTSSRSHAILQISLEYTDRAIGTSAQIFASKLSLVDLAGSERAANTKNRGLRLIEGANINKSLLALGNCINALYEANLKGMKTYIPYRDSKLTRLLKDSLGGNCRTVMIVCISPFYKYFEDTHNTLKYANRAKNIKTTNERNVVSVSYHVAKYTEIITELKKEVKELRKMLKNNKGAGVKVNQKRDESLEGYQKQVDEHFEKEQKVKKLAFEAIKGWDDASWNLLVKQSELNNLKYKSSGESPAIKSLEELVENIQRAQAEYVEKIAKYNTQAQNIEKKRKNLKIIIDELPDNKANLLQNIMQQHIIKINETEQERRAVHEENIIKQKDFYIQMLQEQLQDRIEHLETEETRKNNTVIPQDAKFYHKNIEIMNGKNSKNVKVFNYRLQGGKYADIHLKSESILPPISPKNLPHLTEKVSKIPKYKNKFAEDSSSTSSATDINPVIPASNRNNRHPSRIPRKQAKKQFFSNSEPETKLNENPKISDKFKMSPYVLKKEEKHNQNLYSNKRIPRYGVILRGIEKF